MFKHDWILYIEFLWRLHRVPNHPDRVPFRFLDSAPSSSVFSSCFTKCGFISALWKQRSHLCDVWKELRASLLTEPGCLPQISAAECITLCVCQRVAWTVCDASRLTVDDAHTAVILTVQIKQDLPVFYLLCETFRLTPNMTPAPTQKWFHTQDEASANMLKCFVCQEN